MLFVLFKYWHGDRVSPLETLVSMISVIWTASLNQGLKQYILILVHTTTSSGQSYFILATAITRWRQPTFRTEEPSKQSMESDKIRERYQYHPIQRFAKSHISIKIQLPYRPSLWVKSLRGQHSLSAHSRRNGRQSGTHQIRSDLLSVPRFDFQSRIVKQKRTLLYSIEPGHGVLTTLAWKGRFFYPLIRKK